MNRRWIALLAAVLLIGGALLPTVALADEHEDDPEDLGGNETDETDADEEEEAEEETDDDEASDGPEAEDHDEADGDDEEDEEDDHDDEDDREEKRSLEVESDDEGIEIELEREDASGEDKVEMSFEMDDATFELKYEQEANATEREQKLEATFQTLAEYRDTNNNSKYDPGEPIVSAWALGEDGDEGEDLDIEAGEVQWDRPAVQDITLDGKTGKEITVNASIGENGTFGLRFLVFGDFVDLGNATLEPTSAKIDILIDRYPYQANDTALTLFMETKSETSLEHEDDDDGEGVAAPSSLDGKDVTLRFTWLDTASVDGTDEPVGTTLLKEETEMEREDGEYENETKREFALSYARGEEIVHDPKASVEIASTQLATSPTPGWGALAALGVLGLSALLASRAGTGRR